MQAAGKNRCILFIMLFLAAIVFLPVSHGETDENLLYNGDFEILDADGMPDGWFTDAYLLDPGYSVYTVTEGTEGEGSIAVTVNNMAKNDARFAQTVEVTPGAMYCFSGYIRADGVKDGHGANLSIEGVYAFSSEVYDTEGKWE